MWRGTLRQKTIHQPRNVRNRRGNVLVEFALVLTPFFALILSIVELSLPIFEKSTFTNAVREGCRYGITFQTSYNGTTYGTQTAAITAVVEANSMGFLNSSNANLISVQYYNSTTFAQVTGTGANADGNIVVVSTNGYTYNWIDPIAWFWGGTTFSVTRSPLTINATAADRLETLPVGTTRPSP
jgi:Flp pilus assembly protein TadG